MTTEIQPQRVLTEEELEKIRAETVKIKAETSSLQSKAEAEVLKLNSERLVLEMEMLARQIGMELTKIELDSSKRKEQQELSGDKYHHVYRFNDAIGSSSVNVCMERLAYWNRTDPRCAIEIIFSSPGGSVIDGMALFDFILWLRAQGHNVITSTLGWAASMAGILLQAGTQRIMHREAWVLIHEISFGAGGKIGDVEDTVEWVKRIQERVLDIFAARCKQAYDNGTAEKPLTKAQLKKHWLRKDWWLSSDECLKYGLVDEVR